MYKLSYSVILLVFYTWIIAALPTNPEVCNGFRVTSPTQSGLQWTANSCYQVSYDMGSNYPGSSQIIVDLYNAQTDTRVGTLTTQNTSADGATKPFNLDLGSDPASGDYYFLVMFANGRNCGPKKTATFHVNYNPNSPPAQC
jgi:hypothetical protein